MIKLEKKKIGLIFVPLFFLMLAGVYFIYFSPIRFVGKYEASDDPDFSAYSELGSHDNNLFVLREGHNVYPDELLIFDISERSKPELISGTEFSPSLGGVRGMTIDGEYLFIVSITRGILVVDISRMQSPQLVSEYDWEQHGGYGSTLLVRDKIGYIRSVITDEAERDEQLYVLSLENPLAITVLSATREGGTPLSIENNYLYTAAMFDAQQSARRYLKILDVSDPGNPVVVKELFDVDSLTDAQIQGEKLYLSGGDGFLVADISDPANPLMLGKVEWVSDEIVVDKQYVYALHPWYVQVIDVSDANKPVIIDAERITQGRDFTLVDDYIYVVDWSDGLFVYKTNHATPSLYKRLSSYFYKIQEWFWSLWPE